jgi:methylated-DNA-[protein]-cysteine S-methyltransferase
MAYTQIPTPFGPIGVRWNGETLTGVDLDPAGPASPDTALPEALESRFAEYFTDGSADFDLPIAVTGTPFQRRVWSALRAIPSGSTRTYGEIAAELGSAPRAVGQACRANPCPIAVPCHRVVAVSGLGGFAGDTSGRRVAVKRWLLRHEGALAD